MEKDVKSREVYCQNIRRFFEDYENLSLPGGSEQAYESYNNFIRCFLYETQKCSLDSLREKYLIVPRWHKIFGSISFIFNVTDVEDEGWRILVTLSYQCYKLPEMNNGCIR